MYENGEGIVRDVDQSIYWYKKVCEYENYYQDDFHFLLDIKMFMS